VQDAGGHLDEVLQRQRLRVAEIVGLAVGLGRVGQCFHGPRHVPGEDVAVAVGGARQEQRAAVGQAQPVRVGAQRGVVGADHHRRAHYRGRKPFFREGLEENPLRRIFAQAVGVFFLERVFELQQLRLVLAEGRSRAFQQRVDRGGGGEDIQTGPAVENAHRLLGVLRRVADIVYDDVPGLHGHARQVYFGRAFPAGLAYVQRQAVHGGAPGENGDLVAGFVQAYGGFFAEEAGAAEYQYAHKVLIVYKFFSRASVAGLRAVGRLSAAGRRRWSWCRVTQVNYCPRLCQNILVAARDISPACKKG
jgi:hypothetical protein